MNNTNIDQKQKETTDLLTPEQIILEKLFGYTVTYLGELPNPCWEVLVGHPIKSVWPRKDVIAEAENKLIERYGSVEKAAKEAAGWLNQAFYTAEVRKHRHEIRKHEGFWRNFDPLHNDPSGLGKPLSDLDIIAEALKAGWEG